MTAKKNLPYGTWPSSISGLSITANSVNLDEIQCHSSGTYWIERRPNENGRCVIVKHTSEQTIDLLPAPYSARSRVHEYGGGVYCISTDGVFFSNDNDQNIYFLSELAPPRAITQTSDSQYADLFYDAFRKHLICIRQDESNHENDPSNTLISINVLNGEITTLCSGYDFYSNPRLNPCGDTLSWLCWNHPNMPWDSTELWTANITPDNTLSNNKLIAGSRNTSIFQPEWSHEGTLTFVSDISGWWNLYQYRNNDIHPLTNEHKEFGLPQWVFSQSSYAFINNHEILCAPIVDGVSDISILNTGTGTLTSLGTPWNSFSSIRSLNSDYWFIAASENSFPEIIQLNNKNNKQHIRSATTPNADDSAYSYGQTIKFPTRNNDHAFAIYYAPLNNKYSSTLEERPPLVVLTHGGPTAMSDPTLDRRKQFWTSRGFAVLDVNYSGSTGFGRAYRERLNTNWGIRDAEDCCDAALHICKQGLADPDRLIIKGSSAGGYTVLCALTFYDVFSAGASYYGIGDLKLLLRDTHKFEARYLDRLIGPLPEYSQRYHQRSPLQHVDKLHCPVIFFQGTEDKVVPKEQAEKMFAALRDKGIPVAYVAFEGEQHGFRKAETIKKAIESELYFYCRIFDLPVDNAFELKIENLD